MIHTFPCRIEQGINNTEKIRDNASGRYKDLMIPWDWMLDAGIIRQVCTMLFQTSNSQL